jgi:hypothetical protein
MENMGENQNGRSSEAIISGRLIVWAIIIFAACSYLRRSDASSQQASDQGYSRDMKELRDKFNQDKGKVRLLLLLSPTCPECLHGASEIQHKVLEKIKESDLRTYAVYLPILKTDQERSIPTAMKRFSDNRINFYWDSKGELAQNYSRILPLAHQPAWDIYLLFNRDEEWKTDPPAPDYWMHQLSGVSAERRLDGQKFADETNKLLRISRDR